MYCVTSATDVAADNGIDVIEQFEVRISSIGNVAAAWLEYRSQNGLFIILPLRLSSGGVNPFWNAPKDLEVRVHSVASHGSAFVFAVALTGQPRQGCHANRCLKNASIYACQSLSDHIKF